MAEGNSGTSQMTFVVTLSTPSDGLVSVHYTTVDLTVRVANLDYEPAAGTINFVFGQSQANVSITIVGDTKLEANETFMLKLLNPQNGTIIDGTGMGYILNDDRTSFTLAHPGFTEYLAGNLAPAWGDYNGDGWLDLPLYEGYQGPVFGEIEGFRALLADGNYHGGSWCDYDRDHHLDLALLPYEPPGPGATEALLLHNMGDGSFINVAPSLGMNVQGNGETPVWGDFDADGWPDLFTPYYSHVAPFRSFLFKNNGNGTFTERAVAAGVDLPGLPIWMRPEGAQGVDWNGDGALDLYCASHLFINDGHGNFHDVREAVGLPILLDEGAQFVDYDNDGDLDFYIRDEDSPHLYRNDNGQFTEVTTECGLVPIPFLWGDNWADVDNDGDLDLIQNVAGGPARLMLNRGDGTFERDTTFESFNISSALTAWGDVDADGDQDFVVGQQEKYLFLNRLETKLRDGDLQLQVRVLDERGCESVHGATVRLIHLTDGTGAVETRIVDGGSGYLTQNQYAVSFGGIWEGRYALSITYPSLPGAKVVVDSLVNPLLVFNRQSLLGRRIDVYRDGRVELTDPPSTGVELPGLGAGAQLGGPRPAPASDVVTFAIELSKPQTIALGFYDLLGRRVRRLEPERMNIGPHSLRWDLADDQGAPVPDGVYFCRLWVDGQPAGGQRLVVAR